jgi:mono/diheme cytochrome c family protein
MKAAMRIFSPLVSSSVVALLLAAAFAGCIRHRVNQNRGEALASDDVKPRPTATPSPTPKPDPHAKEREEFLRLVDRGRQVYTAKCVACHNADPRVSGPLGPDVYGSSRPLLEAVLLRLSYPAGYKPKRRSNAMRKMPEVAADIPALTAFLNPPPAVLFPPASPAP